MSNPDGFLNGSHDGPAGGLVVLQELLAGWLPHQPWYVGSADVPVTVRTLARTTLRESDPRVEHLVLEVQQGDARAVYQVPVSVRATIDPRLDHVRVGPLRWPDGGEGWVYDALHDKDATAELISHIAKSDQSGSLEFHREKDVEIPLGEPSTVLTHAHANTSLAFGDAALLKVFRRVEPGTNPDLEIHRVLTEVESTHVAPLFGWVSGQWADPATGAEVTGTLAMLKRFLVTATDGWQLAEASVRDLYAEADLHPYEVGGDFAGEARRLGVAVAEVHADMRRTLSTAELDTARLDALASQMRQRLDAAIVVVPGLDPYAQQLRQAYAELPSLGPGLVMQRVHGDLHLENILRTVLGWKLIDFEGDNHIPLERRVALDSPLRDVASMLRSFDYVAQHLLIADHPGDAQIAYRAAEWSERNAEAFCAGYAAASGAGYPDEPALLRAYLLDKAVQEALHEARLRPHWLPIPMSAVQRLLAA